VADRDWSGGAAVTRILAVVNQKGGVGKTTSTVNLAAALVAAGRRVLVIDLDPQGNASTALGLDHRSGTPGIYDVLTQDLPLAQIVQPCPDLPGLLAAPATIDLAGAEIELVSLVAREGRLARALGTYLEQSSADSLSEGIGEPIEVVFIDCPPSLGLLTLNALVAAGEVLLPIQCEYYALEGVSQLLRTVELVQRHLNPGLRIGAVLLTMYDGRTRLSAQVVQEVRAHFGEVVLPTLIPRSVRMSEAPSFGQTIVTYDPASVGALAYADAAAELMAGAVSESEAAHG
jgi:chromosome partitioning protein